MEAHHFAMCKTSGSLFLILLLVQLPYYLLSVCSYLYFFAKDFLLWAPFFFMQSLKWQLLAISNMSQDTLLET